MKMAVTNHHKIKIALFIALAFHMSGVIGMLSNYQSWFICNTPFTLTLMFCLIIFTEKKIEQALIIFMLLAFCVGMLTEMIGVNTGLLFGSYNYGTVMGVKIAGVPLLIGLNWLMITYGAATTITQLNQWLYKKYQLENWRHSKLYTHLSILIDGALLATFFDWVMEPVAIYLQFWTWHSNSIPLKNYFCWFIISAFLMWCFKKLGVKAENQFAIHLFIIQLLFFVALRILLL